MSTHRDRIGVLIIGQTPRADLTAPLEHLSGMCEFTVRGALDRVERVDMPGCSADSYPLVTRLRDGTRITVDERFLTPLLQAAIDELEREGVTAILLLCAGPFRDLVSSRPLIRPFQLATLVLQSLGLQRVCVIVPTHDQAPPAQAKWEEAGLDPIVISSEEKPDQQPLEDWVIEGLEALPGPAALVLDYVGHPAAILHELHRHTHLPVVDLGQLAVKVVEAVLTPRAFPTSSNGGPSV